MSLNAKICSTLLLDVLEVNELMNVMGKHGKRKIATKCDVILSLFGVKNMAPERHSLCTPMRLNKVL